MERSDAAEVIEYALDLLIKITNYTPKMRDLVEIAQPLPFIIDSHRAKSLVGRFDSQKATVARLAASEDYVRLELLLARTESRYDVHAAHNRIVELYWFIANLRDLSTKTACTAWMVTSLHHMDQSDDLETKEGLPSILNEDLTSSIEQLLSETADHYLIARGSIVALSETQPAEALDLCKSLNTRQRRNRALYSLVEHNCKLPNVTFDIEFMIKVIQTFDDTILRGKAVLDLVKHLSVYNGNRDTILLFCETLIILVKQIEDASERCEALCHTYKFINDSDTLNMYSNLTKSLVPILYSSWGAIDVGWAKVDTGFKIASLMAIVSPDIAREYLLLSNNLKNELAIDSDGPALVFISCLRLAIRAFAGLLRTNIFTETDSERLERLIRSIPSNGERIGMWSELACRCSNSEHKALCDKIVTEHVKPLLNDMSDDDGEYKNAVVAYSAPALYAHHKHTALERIAQLPQPFMDDGYLNICDFIFTGIPLRDPIDRTSKSKYVLSFETVVDICEILSYVQYDMHIFMIIVILCDSLTDRKNKSRITDQQRADIVQRLEHIVNFKLPDSHNIKHEGYKIACKAVISRLQRSEITRWDDLINEARLVPNMADKALVMTLIAEYMPSRFHTEKERLFDEAVTWAEKIPADLDRSNRFEAIAKYLISFNPIKAKRLLKLGMELTSVGTADKGMYAEQQRIIDLAHKLSPNFAASLVSLLDDDPARAENKLKLRRRVETLDLAKKMADQEIPESDRRGSANIPKAAWINLGRLNAGRIETIDHESMRVYFQIAADFPISDAYAILSWIIQNAVLRYSKTDRARTYLSPIFEATLLGAELAGRVAARSLAQLRNIASTVQAHSSLKDSFVIRAGESRRAISFLRDWFRSSVSEYLKISDPYFGVDDLGVLAMIRSENPKCKVSVMTSSRHQGKLPKPWDESYRSHWRLKISDQDPPETEILIIGMASTGYSPIHDRWWITKGGGLRIGTSFNSLGITKTSEIEILSKQEAAEREAEIDLYLYRQVREYNREKLQFNLFSL
jgi:hypothetical protein